MKGACWFDGNLYFDVKLHMWGIISASDLKVTGQVSDIAGEGLPAGHILGYATVAAGTLHHWNSRTRRFLTGFEQALKLCTMSQERKRNIRVSRINNNNNRLVRNTKAINNYVTNFLGLTDDNHIQSLKNHYLVLHNIFLTSILISTKGILDL